MSCNDSRNVVLAVVVVVVVVVVAVVAKQKERLQVLCRVNGSGEEGLRRLWLWSSLEGH